MRLTQAAAQFHGESHQVAAFNAIELMLTPEQLAQFEETFTAGPPLPLCPTMAQLLQRHQHANPDPEPA